MYLKKLPKFISKSNADARRPPHHGAVLLTGAKSVRGVTTYGSHAVQLFA